jgi:16S rRNA (cytosine1402-N4)-methyltransferase
MMHALTSTRVKRHPIREEDGSHREWKSGQAPHKSVLIKEVVELINPQDEELIVDATGGQGGHSEALLKAAHIKLIALDADLEAVAALEARLKRYRTRATVVNANFADLSRVLRDNGVTTVNAVLFDLGWRSEQLTAGRGFSFLNDEPLNMSYGIRPRSGFTAAEILNSWDEKVIADVLFGYGEERYARRIAKAVVLRRKISPIETTIELVELVRDAVPASYRHGKIHPATKTFQALRIAVNDELQSLEVGLNAAWEYLAKGGRVAVISFHSLEDRIVKRYFAELARKNRAELLTKKPPTATQTEIIHNPSARSAKLRAIKKIK